MRRSLWGLLLVPGLAWAAPMVVHVVRAARGTYRPAFPVFARVHGPLHTTIKAPYDAIMGPLPVAPGSMVAAGAVIARLRPLSLAVTVRALRAEAAAAHTAYAQARVLARQGLVTPARAQSLRARWQAAVAAWRADGARLAQGTVRAPYAGTVRYLASPGARLTRGARVAAIGGAGGAYETCALTIREADRLYAGARAVIAAQGRARPPGHVYALGARADHLGFVRAYVRGLPKPLRPGQVLRLILLGHRQRAIVVPRTALMVRHGRARLYVLRRGRAQAVAVKILHIGTRQAFVAGAVVRGARVIDSHVARLRAGVAVRAVS